MEIFFFLFFTCLSAFSRSPPTNQTLALVKVSSWSQRGYPAAISSASHSVRGVVMGIWEVEKNYARVQKGCESRFQLEVIEREKNLQRRESNLCTFVREASGKCQTAAAESPRSRSEPVHQSSPFWRLTGLDCCFKSGTAGTGGAPQTFGGTKNRGETIRGSTGP